VLRRVPLDEACGGATGFSPWGSTSESSLWQGAEGSAPGHFQVSTSFTAFEITKVLRLFAILLQRDNKKTLSFQSIPLGRSHQGLPIEKGDFHLHLSPRFCLLFRNIFRKRMVLFSLQRFYEKDRLQIRKKDFGNLAAFFSQRNHVKPLFWGPKS